MTSKTKASPFDVRWQNLTLAAVLLREIMEKPLEGETPQARLKQLGMMNLIYTLHMANLPLTLTQITEVTGLTRGGAAETIDQLVARGLLTEQWGTNAMGRGKAKEYAISTAIFEALKSGS
jgi:DNA-binding MarR family transcriptional regulator